MVSECCILGLPDKDYGDAVCAIIVPQVDEKKKREGELKPAISLEELCTWAKEKLAPYKVLQFAHLYFFSFAKMKTTIELCHALSVFESGMHLVYSKDVSLSYPF